MMTVMIDGVTFERRLDPDGVDRWYWRQADFLHETCFDNTDDTVEPWRLLACALNRIWTLEDLL